MGEREDNVYKAKLAEQAERYDGESSIIFSQIPFLLFLQISQSRIVVRFFKAIIIPFDVLSFKLLLPFVQVP